jgi:hypothetical protein
MMDDDDDDDEEEEEEEAAAAKQEKHSFMCNVPFLACNRYTEEADHTNQDQDIRSSPCLPCIYNKEECLCIYITSHHKDSSVRL